MVQNRLKVIVGILKLSALVQILAELPRVWVLIWYYLGCVHDVACICVGGGRFYDQVTEIKDQEIKDQVSKDQRIF